MSPVPIDGSPLPPPVSVAPEVCPRSLPDPLPRRAVPGVGSSMVPAVPSALVVCVSRTRTVVDQPEVQRIAGRLNLLKRVGSPHIFACPLDLGSTYALYFDYAGGSTLLVRVDASGCRFAANGRITAAADVQLLRLLQRLVA